MMRSPEQQYALAKTLPLSELQKVVAGQSDIVDMWVADAVGRAKAKQIKAQQGAAAQQTASAPKVVERDMADFQQVLAKQSVPQPRMDQGVASLPGDVDVPEYAGGGIVAFQAGGQSSLPFSSSVGPALQSDIKPGPGPTFASKFPGVAAAEKAAAEAVKASGGRISFTTALKRFLGPAYALYELGRFHKTGMDYDTGMGFGTPEEQMTVGTIMQSPRERVVDRVIAAKPVGQEAEQPSNAPAAPGSSDQAPPPAPKRTEEGIAKLVAPRLPIPAELTPAEAGRERLDYYKSRGISEDPFKTAREMLEKDRATDAEARREAGWSRVLEAAFGIMGGESPYAFTNIGKGAQAAAKGAAEDMKDFRKLERDRKREEARLAVDQNNYLKSGADSDLAKVEKRRDTINSINVDQAKIDKDIYVADKQLEIQRLARQDTREATLKATALKEAQDQLSDMLRRNQVLANDPKFNYRAELDALYRANLARLLNKETPATTAAPSGPRGKVVNGVYVPAGQ